MLKMFYLLSQQCYITNTISPPGQGFSTANTHLFMSNVLSKKLKNRLRKDLYLKPGKLSNYINPLSRDGSIIPALICKFILCFDSSNRIMLVKFRLLSYACWLSHLYSIMLDTFHQQSLFYPRRIHHRGKGSLKISRIYWNKPYILNITVFNRVSGLSFLSW